MASPTTCWIDRRWITSNWIVTCAPDMGFVSCPARSRMDTEAAGGSVMDTEVVEGSRIQTSVRGSSIIKGGG